MKKSIFFFLLLFVTTCSIFAQNAREYLMNTLLTEIYVDLEVVSREKVDDLSRQFSIDHVSYEAETNVFRVRLWLAKRDYRPFLALNLPFQIADLTDEKSEVEMALTYAELSAQWDRYPSYPAYREALSFYSSCYPDLCRIDTILYPTPRNHAIFAVRLGREREEGEYKPPFFYSSTMHGDEPVGYYMMLRLIDYILKNQQDSLVSAILDKTDLWICPLENPDGTYYTGDHILGSFPVSRRANASGYDLNRSYPPIDGMLPGAPEPEVEAMIEFVSSVSPVLSANLHGGAELYNYPWDAFRSSDKKHPDSPWWTFMGERFTERCRQRNPAYFPLQQNVVTAGGDWYIITGSRQDYMNHYMGCREATIEMSTKKVVASSLLPSYWEYARDALLNYIVEGTYGFSGIITDKESEKPIEAAVCLYNAESDSYGFFCFSDQKTGRYFRPIFPGNYSVIFMSKGYDPQMHTLTVTDKETRILNIALERSGETEGFFSVYPNPSSEYLIIRLKDFSLLQAAFFLTDLRGNIVYEGRLSNIENKIDIRFLSQGLYIVHVPGIKKMSRKFVKR